MELLLSLSPKEKRDKGRKQTKKQKPRIRKKVRCHYHKNYDHFQKEYRIRTSSEEKASYTHEKREHGEVFKRVFFIITWMKVQHAKSGNSIVGVEII